MGRTGTESQTMGKIRAYSSFPKEKLEIAQCQGYQSVPWVFASLCPHVPCQKPQVQQGAHLCLICEKSFTKAEGWFLHASQKHNYQSLSGRAVTGNTCFCCTKQYLTTERLRHHLRYSAACRNFFLSVGDQIPPSLPNISEHPLMLNLQAALSDFLVPTREEAFIPNLGE